MTSISIKASTAAVFAVFLWAAAPVLIKMNVAAMPLLPYLVVRYGIALLLFLWTLPGLWRKRVSIPLRPVGLLAIVAPIHVGLQAFCLTDIPVSWHAVVFALSPLLTLIFLRTNADRSSLVSLAPALLGVFLMMAPDHSSPTPFLLSIIALSGALASWVSMCLLVKKLQGHLTDWEITGSVNGMVFLPAVLVWILSGAAIPVVPVTTLGLTMAAAIMVPLGFVAFSYGIRILPGFGITSQYLEPVFGIGLGYAIFGEKLTLAGLIGASLVLAGVFLGLRQPRGDVSALKNQQTTCAEQAS